MEGISLSKYGTREFHMSDDSTPLRLQTINRMHFPEYIPSTKSKERPQKRCRVCSKHQIRKDTSWQCKEFFKFGDDGEPYVTPQEYILQVSSRGTPILTNNGYTYAKRVRKEIKTIRDQQKHWRCTFHWKGCRAAGVMDDFGNFRVKSVHNHFPME